MAEDNKSMDKGRRLLIGFIIVLLLLTQAPTFLGFTILPNIFFLVHR